MRILGSQEMGEECSVALGPKLNVWTYGLVVECWTDVQEDVGSRVGRVRTVSHTGFCDVNSLRQVMKRIWVVCVVFLKKFWSIQVWKKKLLSPFKWNKINSLTNLNLWKEDFREVCLSFRTEDSGESRWNLCAVNWFCTLKQF